MKNKALVEAYYSTKYSKVLFTPIWIFPKLGAWPKDVFPNNKGAWREVYGAVNIQHESFFNPQIGKIFSPQSKEDEEAFKIAEKFLLNAIEINLRQMILNCAFKIYVPLISKSFKRHLNLAPPTVRKRISFVDKHDEIWKAVQKYLQPIYECLPNNSYNAAFIGWYLFCLVIATKKGAELPFNYLNFSSVIHGIRNNYKLSGEANARLCNIEGICNMFSVKDSISSFRVLPRLDEFSISERIEDILSDAYLLEASYLRKFFSISSNKAAIKKDISKLIKFILKRNWAKKILTEASQNLLLSNSHARILEHIIEILPEIHTNNIPVLLPPLENICYDKNYRVNIAVRNRNHWDCLMVMPNKD
ncbi:MAG: hypothetical protein A2X64_02895 [Ignavibacteria bacterium GWF2_33_9]|nr:MAG: hypothetical protein A2X64_02895 [Ignavibacteria bacterium GWF2_33_9]